MRDMAAAQTAALLSFVPFDIFSVTKLYSTMRIVYKCTTFLQFQLAIVIMKEETDLRGDAQDARSWSRTILKPNGILYFRSFFKRNWTQFFIKFSSREFFLWTHCRNKFQTEQKIIVVKIKIHDDEEENTKLKV